MKMEIFLNKPQLKANERKALKMREVYKDFQYNYKMIFKMSKKC